MDHIPLEVIQMILREVCRAEGRGVVRCALVCARFTKPSLERLYRHISITSYLDAKLLLCSKNFGQFRTLSLVFHFAEAAESVWREDCEAVLRGCTEIKELKLGSVAEVPPWLFTNLSLPKLEKLSLCCHFMQSGPSPSNKTLANSVPLLPFPLSDLIIICPNNHTSAEAVEIGVARSMPRLATSRVKLCVAQCRLDVLQTLSPLVQHLIHVVLIMGDGNEISDHLELLSAPYLEQIILSSVSNADIQYVLQNGSRSTRRFFIHDVEENLLSLLTIQKLVKTLGKTWGGIQLLGLLEFEVAEVMKMGGMRNLIETVVERNISLAAKGVLHF